MGAVVKVFDPEAQHNYQQAHPEQQLIYCDSAAAAAENSDTLLILTDWDAFRYLPWAELGKKMNQQIIVDMRNMLDSSDLVE